MQGANVRPRISTLCLMLLPHAMLSAPEERDKGMLLCPSSLIYPL